MEVAESGSCSQTRGTERAAQFTTTSGCNIIMKREMSVSDQIASLITQIRQTQLSISGETWPKWWEMELKPRPVLRST